MIDMLELTSCSQQRLETNAEHVVIEFTEGNVAKAHRSGTSLLSFSEATSSWAQLKDREVGRCCGAAQQHLSRFGQAACSDKLLRLSTTVDCPIFALHGSKAERRSSVCKVILVWLAPGFTLAWDTVQLKLGRGTELRNSRSVGWQHCEQTVDNLVQDGAGLASSADPLT